MSETVYLKCPCQHCGNSIEFPEQGVGQLIPCPHCHHSTRLDDPRIHPAASSAEPSSTVTPVTGTPSVPLVSAAPEPGPPSRRKGRPLLAGLAVLILAVAGIIGFSAWQKSRSKPGNLANPPAVQKTSFAQSTAPTGQPPVLVTAHDRNDQNSSEAPPLAKSLSELKVGAITLSPAKGSSLVYATGRLTNDSPHQRFGVKIEIGLTDAGGRDAGVARDYRNVIEPGGVWNFRALVLDSKAVAGTVKQIIEEP